MKQTKSRIEKRGEHGTCEVTGWRCDGDSVWHVKVRPDNRDVRRNAYKVMSGMFEPDAAGQAEREAVLHLIANGKANTRRFTLPDCQNVPQPFASGTLRRSFVGATK
jgi:hypothetical protein